MSHSHHPGRRQTFEMVEMERGTRRIGHSTHERPVREGQDEDHTGSDPPILKVTAFRLFYSVVILSFGIPKAILSYRGESIVPTTFDLMMGMVFAIVLYWLDKLEAQPRMAWLFHKDLLGPIVKRVCTICGIHVHRGIGADKRLRVFVVGPPGVGKTTLLVRLGDIAGGGIVTRNGEHITDVSPEYDQRGIDRVTDEITYASIPNFVFHEMRTVRDFVDSSSGSKRAHVIWFCFPTGSPVVIGLSYFSIFSEMPRSVPVLTIFTKTYEMMEIYQRGPYPEEEFAIFIQYLERELGKQSDPPAGFFQLPNMDHDSEDSRALCHQLLRRTRTLSQLPHGGSPPISA